MQMVGMEEQEMEETEEERRVWVRVRMLQLPSPRRMPLLVPPPPVCVEPPARNEPLRSPPPLPRHRPPSVLVGLEEVVEVVVEEAMVVEEKKMPSAAFGRVVRFADPSPRRTPSPFPPLLSGVSTGVVRAPWRFHILAPSLPPVSPPWTARLFRFASALKSSLQTQTAACCFGLSSHEQRHFEQNGSDYLDDSDSNGEHRHAVDSDAHQKAVAAGGGGCGEQTGTTTTRVPPSETRTALFYEHAAHLHIFFAR